MNTLEGTIFFALIIVIASMFFSMGVNIGRGTHNDTPSCVVCCPPVNN